MVQGAVEVSRILNMIGRGVLRSSRATGGFYRELAMQLQADDPEDVQHFQIHGLESRPQEGAQGIVLAMSGNADHLVALIAGASTLNLAAGESALKNDHGWSIQMKETSIDFVKDGIVKLRVTNTNIYLGDPNSPALLPIARLGDPIIGGGGGTIGPTPVTPTTVSSV